MTTTSGQWSIRFGSTRLLLSVDSVIEDGAAEHWRAQRWIEQLIFDGLHGGDPRLNRVLHEIAEMVGGPRHTTDPDDRDTTIETLRRSVREGRISVDEEVPAPTNLVTREDLGDELIDPFADDDEEPAPAPEPEPDLAWFEIKVVDEVGDPIPDLRLTITIEHEAQTLTTDGNGIVRVDDVEASYGTAQVTVPQELRDIVTPRWATPREPNIPESTPEQPVEVERLDDHFDPVGLSRRKPVLLVITPRFECREVAATTYDFGRSFIRRDGIPSLAAIAQELHQDDGQQAMIFGHTDLSGSEELNKRLSERRAKAVFAVFTHDFDHWEDMWRARVNEHPWWERWGTRQAQHMLNALECPDDDGNELGEDGDKGRRTNESIRRFKRGDYPHKPAEQAELPDTSTADSDFRRELFFAYAKLITREPVDPARFVAVGGSPFMGCGEYNPLSLAAKDEQSRRTVVFVFDPAAAPQDPPCEIGSVSPCRGILDDPPEAENEDGEPNPGPFYRCQFYQSIATCCRSAGGADLAHDVIVRFFIPLADANELPHRFILEAEDQADEDDDDDPDFSQEQSLGDDARAFVADEPAEEPPDEDDDNDNDNDDDGSDDTDDDDDAGGTGGDTSGTDDADDDDAGETDDDADDDDADDDDDGPPPNDNEGLAALQQPMCEIRFTHVPDAHAYRLRVEGVDEPYSVFVGTRFHDISELSAPTGVTRFPTLHAILNPPPPPPPPTPDPPADNSGGSTP